MKKIISVLLVLVFAAMPLLVSADNFVPSISYKPAPDVVPADPVTGVLGVITDAQGQPSGDGHEAEVYEDCIVITPVSDAATSTDIPDEAAAILLRVYDELLNQNTKLSDLSAELNDLVAAQLGNGKNADNLVVKELFDVSILCDEMANTLSADGNTLDLTFKLSVEDDDHVFIMTYNDNKWTPVENVTNNGDGTVTATFERFCPVAVFVEGVGSSDSPDTGDFDMSYVWAIVAVVSAVLIVAVVVINRRTAKSR